MHGLEFGAKLRVTTNLYVVCVAEKGAGKTPSAKMFMEPLAKLEKEETAAYNIAGYIL